MISKYNSAQEEFWAGEFGNAYISRNQGDALLASNVAFFAEIFSSIPKLPETFLELGANIGMNISAIKNLAPQAAFTGVEINSKACQLLAETGCEVLTSSILEAEISSQYDFVFSKGVLIHLSPDQLDATYERMYRWSRQYILIAEYYNPVPVGVTYRGNSDRLFKRDFAGEFLDKYPTVILRDYGFAYHREKFPQDDINWFLCEKVSNK